MIKKLWRKIYRKVAIRFKGVPVAIIVYKPHLKGDNVHVTMAEMLKFDQRIHDKLKELAELIREEHQETLDRALEEAKE